MEKETKEKIDNLATYVTNSMTKIEIEKIIYALNNIRYPYRVRQLILRVMEPYFNDRNGKALITVHDYVNCLFLDSDSWLEIRSALLLAIYGKLCEIDFDMR